MRKYVVKRLTNLIQGFLCLMLIYGATIDLMGQSLQQGRVKTLGRPQKPSKGLPDVVISIAEVPNVIKSNQQGLFSFYPKGKKFILSRITKNNYQLTDQSMIGRMFPFSADVPLEIVMVSSQELMKEKKRIEDNAYERAERKYKKKLADLQQQIEQHTLNSNEAEKERIRIGENYQRYVRLIGQMAERYASTDYDGISNTNMLIMQCIEDGELERADSLINSKGDFKQRESELKEQEQITKKAEEFVKQSRISYDQKLNDLAQDYFNKHSILIGNYQNDSAAYYMERRCLLDTTKVEWMIEAGKFVNDYLADYQQAIKYYRHAKSISTKLFGKKSLQVAKCDNLIGKSMIEQGLYNRAMEHLIEARGILESESYQNTTELADCYANIATIFLKVENLPYINAQKAIKRALDLTRNLYGENDVLYAKILMMNAEMSMKMKNSSMALKDMYRVQKIYMNLQGESQADNAWNNYYLGIALSRTHEYSQGRNHIREALNSWKQMFGDHHPYMSYAYGALGDSYMEENAYQEADSCYKSALSNQRIIFGDSHPYMAECYDKLSRLYRKQKNYLEASRYEMNALNATLQSDEFKVNEAIDLMQNVDLWLSMLEKDKHSDQELKQLYLEFWHLKTMYNKNINKKIIIKNIRI